MTQPIRFGKKPLYKLLICLLATPSVAFSEGKPAWNCQQNSVSGEWSCEAEQAVKPANGEPIKAETTSLPAPLETTSAFEAPETEPVSKTGTEPQTRTEKLPVESRPLVQKQPGWNCSTDSNNKWDCALNGPETVYQAEEKQVEPDLQQQAAAKIIEPETQKPLPGWACEAGDEAGSWDCKLTGIDPQGKLRLAPGIEKATAKGTESYEAFVFREMLASIPLDPWANCSSELGASPVYRSETTRQLREASPATIESDFSEAFESDEVVAFSGNVKFERADQTLRSDRLTHDSLANTLSAQGNVIYREEGLTIQSDKSFLWLDSDQAKLHQSNFIFETIPARGSSKLTTLESKTLSVHRDISYTTCNPGNQDWLLDANKLTLDQQSGEGAARNVWVRFKNIPLFYAPYLTFPIDDRRKSGFLMPSFGSGDESGFDLAAPYYWNIAPNLDATFTPRYLSKRGFLFGAETRYLTENTESSVALEYIANDRKLDKSRGQIQLENRTRFSDRLLAEIDLNMVSDDDYLDDFGNSLSLNSTRHLYSHADLNYRGQGWSLLGRFDGYQTIDRDVVGADQPYRRLPQILFNLHNRQGPANSKVAMRSELVYFDRGDSVTGQRLDIQPEISWPVRRAAGFVTPRLALQSTHYWLDDQVAGASDQINRTLPILSVDSGLFFEREFNSAGTAWQQTLEPRLFYLFIPNDDQDDIPDFDTGEYDFSFSQLFRHNRFSGADRLNDANQLTAALTTRFIEEESGRERLRASIGQIFYFRDREVTLPGQTKLTDSSSDLVTELDALITDNWTFRGGYQWDPHRGESKKGSASLRYRNGTSRLFNLGYQFRDGVIDQTDVSARWPLSSTWHAVARWNYSLRDEIILDSFLGLEKESCCWRVKFLVRHSVDDIDSDPETAFFLQLELKGLTSFGEKLDSMLSKEIPGYQLPNAR